MNNIHEKEVIPKELDDAIYGSLLTTPEKWKVVMLRHRNKERYNLGSLVKNIQIESCNAYWDWDEKMYWGYSVSERIMNIVNARINEYKALHLLEEEKRQQQHLETVISTI